MATYVPVHGGFWGSWCWSQVSRLLRGVGHHTYAPSPTGIGERVHLASPAITLDTHVLDVCGSLTPRRTGSNGALVGLITRAGCTPVADPP